MKLISQAEARIQGLTRFYTGKPCIRGHLAPRQTSNFRCVKCGFLKSRKYERDNPEIKNAANRRQYAKLKLSVCTSPGSHCECCQESELAFLCIDHKNGGGNKHRKAVGSTKLLRMLRRQIQEFGAGVVKKDFRLLCWNCNSAVHFYGTCPHQSKRKNKK